jgi:hypothetical protein
VPLAVHYVYGQGTDGGHGHIGRARAVLVQIGDVRDAAGVGDCQAEVPVVLLTCRVAALVNQPEAGGGAGVLAEPNLHRHILKEPVLRRVTCADIVTVPVHADGGPEPLVDPLLEVTVQDVA